MKKIILLSICTFLICCNGNVKDNSSSQDSSVTDSIIAKYRSSLKDSSATDSINDEEEYDSLGLPKYYNSVKGHKEEEYIVGNFTGSRIDTLYIDYDYDVNKLSKHLQRKYGLGLVGGGHAEEHQIRYAVSNNPALPPVELFCPNGLVFEGDVDGDGKDEWGYLYESFNSQWRQYRIYTFDTKTKTWKHLYYGELLDTPEYVRASGVDLVEKGPKKGLIKINWGSYDGIVHDTIVKPTYTPISKDAW